MLDRCGWRIEAEGGAWVPRASRTKLGSRVRERMQGLTLAYRSVQAVTPSGNGVSPSQLRAAHALQHYGPMRTGQLGQLLGLSPNGVTLLLDALEASGWVKRARDPKDRRALVVTLSDAGRRGLVEEHQPSVEPLSALLDDLTDDELRALDQGLEVLERAIARRAADATRPAS